MKVPLRISTLIAVAACTSLACGGSSGGDGRGPVQVLEGEAALQAAAHSALGMASVIDLLLDDGGSGGIASARTASGEQPASLARAQSIGCDRGGSASAQCREEGRTTRLTSRFDNCSILDPSTGLIVTSNGELDVTLRGIELCRIRELPAELETTVVLRNFSEEKRDGDRVIQRLSTSHLEQTTRPKTGGCSRNDGQISIAGDVNISAGAGDFEMRIDALEVDVSSAGNPCREAIIAGGRVDIRDVGRGSRFVTAFESLQATRARGLDGFDEVSIDGTLDIDCLGQVRLRSNTPLALSGACPAEGSLDISIDGGSTAAATFSPAGLSMDYDGDGSEDFASQSCSADTVNVCM